MNSQLTDVSESSFIAIFYDKIMALNLMYQMKTAEYDDQILWIEKPEVGAAAAQIVDEREYTPCKITKIVSESDFDSEEEYAEASDALLDESDALCTGEFITMDGAFFVEMDAAGETEEYESVEFDDVDFC